MFGPDCWEVFVNFESSFLIGVKGIAFTSNVQPVIPGQCVGVSITFENVTPCSEIIF